jgi:hypothetical protein
VNTVLHVLSPSAGQVSFVGDGFKVNEDDGFFTVCLLLEGLTQIPLIEPLYVDILTMNGSATGK